jgi:TonB family protein
LALALIGAGCRSASAPGAGGGATSPAETEAPTGESADLDRPSPVLPDAAFLLSEYAALELKITAAPDGSIQQVIVSKPSRAKLYDEYTRDWVAKHWKMPAAKADEPELREFIAPIVYPKATRPPDGYYPPPNYPARFIEERVTGLVIVEIKVAPSGQIESAVTISSSGHKQLDDYTTNWVQKKWKFPPSGKPRRIFWPVTYLIVSGG